MSWKVPPTTVLQNNSPLFVHGGTAVVLLTLWLLAWRIVEVQMRKPAWDPQHPGSPRYKIKQLLDLPDDILLEIIQWLEPRDVSALMQTCKGLHSGIEHSRTIWAGQLLDLVSNFELVPTTYRISEMTTSQLREAVKTPFHFEATIKHHPYYLTHGIPTRLAFPHDTPPFIVLDADILRGGRWLATLTRARWSTLGLPYGAPQTEYQIQLWDISASRTEGKAFRACALAVDHKPAPQLEVQIDAEGDVLLFVRSDHALLVSKFASKDQTHPLVPYRRLNASFATFGLFFVSGDYFVAHGRLGRTLVIWNWRKDESTIVALPGDGISDLSTSILSVSFCDITLANLQARTVSKYGPFQWSKLPVFNGVASIDDQSVHRASPLVDESTVFMGLLLRQHCTPASHRIATFKPWTSRAKTWSILQFKNQSTVVSLSGAKRASTYRTDTPLSLDMHSHPWTGFPPNFGEQSISGHVMSISLRGVLSMYASPEGLSGAIQKVYQSQTFQGFYTGEARTPHPFVCAYGGVIGSVDHTGIYVFRVT